MQQGRVLRRDLTMRLCLRAARSHSPARKIGQDQTQIALLLAALALLIACMNMQSAGLSTFLPGRPDVAYQTVRFSPKSRHHSVLGVR